MEKEYIVSLKKDIDYDEFWHQIENQSSEDGFVPSRRVDIVNNRDGSLRSCHYALTDAEAEQLRNDPRVYSVNIPPEQDPNIVLTSHINIQNGNFTKGANYEGDYVNYGIRRCIDENNPYGDSQTVSGPYYYWNDGTGVDVVIIDSGVEANHPEWQDSKGVSRLQQINWATESGLPFTQPANFYTDYNGHGTACIGVTAGKNYGWAKNARIYSMKMDGLQGSGNPSGISQTYAFDAIKIWHQNKPIMPNTGYRRPTVVNMSFGYNAGYNSLTGVYYQGVFFNSSQVLNDAQYRYANYGVYRYTNAGGFNYTTNTRIGSVDSDVQEMTDAGIHIAASAGNDQMYNVYTNDFWPNYNNYLAANTGTLYYQRGLSPYSNSTIKVGAIDGITVYSPTKEYKANFSNAGPGINVYAPGSAIVTSVSNTSQIGGPYPYFWNNSYGQTNVSGTSFAGPQVAGVLALYLQSNPGATPAQAKSWLVNNAGLAKIYDPNNGFYDYTNTRSLFLNGSAGENRYLYWPFAYNQPVQMTTSGPVNIRATISYT